MLARLPEFLACRADDAPCEDSVTVTVEVTDDTGRVRTARLEPPVATWTVG